MQHLQLSSGSSPLGSASSRVAERLSRVWTEGCGAQATTIGLDGCPRCGVCQLDWLSAEEQGIESSYRRGPSGGSGRRWRARVRRPRRVCVASWLRCCAATR